MQEKRCSSKNSIDLFPLLCFIHHQADTESLKQYLFFQANYGMPLPTAD